MVVVALLGGFTVYNRHHQKIEYFWRNRRVFKGLLFSLPRYYWNKLFADKLSVIHFPRMGAKRYCNLIKLSYQEVGNQTVKSLHLPYNRLNGKKAADILVYLAFRGDYDNITSCNITHTPGIPYPFTAQEMGAVSYMIFVKNQMGKRDCYEIFDRPMYLEESLFTEDRKVRANIRE